MPEHPGHLPLTVENSSFHVDLFRMSDGQPYANNIQQSVMKSSYEPLTRIVWAHLQLTSCRLAARVVTIPADDLLDPGTTDLYIWDWRTGKLWLVSCSICSTGNEQTS